LLYAPVGHAAEAKNPWEYRCLAQKRRFVLGVTFGAEETVKASRKEWEVAMNHSIYSADRSTHLKIIAVSLLCATLVVGIGKFARVSAIDLGTAPLVKAGQSKAVTGQLPVIR
jgi:hypothetical protein